MELLNPQRSVVTVIDLQGKLMDMIYRPELVIAASIRLLKLADLFQVPVILTEQYPKGLGKTHPDVLEVFNSLTTQKHYLEKTSFGCCGDSQFAALLQKSCPDIAKSDRQIVVAGIEAHVCVLQTVLELLQDDQEVYLCWDCVSGRGEEYRKHALDRMTQAGAFLTNHESVGFEWARDKSHPNFKAVNQIFREGQLV